MRLFPFVESVMSVLCIGAPWVPQQLGEKRDFETELSRVGFRHEEFVLHVNPKHAPRPKARGNSRYEVKVTHMPTQTVKTYVGGPRENWLAHFAEELAGGLYGEPSLSREGNGPPRRAAREKRPRCGRQKQAR
jgi:hypothetical protein